MGASSRQPIPPHTRGLPFPALPHVQTDRGKSRLLPRAPRGDPRSLPKEKKPSSLPCSCSRTKRDRESTAHSLAPMAVSLRSQRTNPRFGLGSFCFHEFYEHLPLRSEQKYIHAPRTQKLPRFRRGVYIAGWQKGSELLRGSAGHGQLRCGARGAGPGRSLRPPEKAQTKDSTATPRQAPGSVTCGTAPAETGTPP